ncbi:MAG TPA: 30S ribosomal protein S16 [Polyangia bacterium]|jgi:small subunit ribosomal protein S16
MAVKMRLSRAGAKKAPFYRVVVADAKSPRDGRHIEQIGTYDPRQNPAKVTFDEARLEHWLKVGAVPSQTVGELIQRSRKAAAAATPAA